MNGINLSGGKIHIYPRHFSLQAVCVLDGLYLRGKMEFSGIIEIFKVGKLVLIKGQ